MRALILESHSPIEEAPLKLTDLPRPAPGDNQILVRISVCGACHTDLDEVEGRLEPTMSPIVPGHQIVGTVVDRGRAVTRFEVGERVGITWLFSSCGDCEFCRAGSENLCDRARWTGKDANGGYAEFTVIGENFALRNDHCPITDSIDFLEYMSRYHDDLVPGHAVDEFADLVLLIRVETIGRFVEHQHSRIMQNGLCKPDAAFVTLG